MTSESRPPGDEAMAGGADSPLDRLIEEVDLEDEETADLDVNDHHADNKAFVIEPPEPQFDQGEERDLRIVRPAVFRAHPFHYSGLILAFFGGLVLAGLARWDDRVPLWLQWAGVVISGLALAWFCPWWVYTAFRAKLRITNKRTIHRVGILARNTSEVPHKHIRNVRIEQSFIQRLLGVGRVCIDSSAGGGGDVREIDMADVIHPHELQAMIDPYRKL